MAEEDADETKVVSEDKKYEAVAKQVADEYSVDEKHGQPWKDTKRTYLKLYINQRKNPKKVGDTLMFSTHQTILAALYNDHLTAEWMWREEEDTDRVDQLNALYEFDYDEMEKPSLDYGKYWDACFFGIAFEDWSHFDRDVLTPLPTLWDPLTTYIDWQATSINGDRLGRGAARRLGRWIVRTKADMEKAGFKNLDKLDEDNPSSDLLIAQQARDEARGLSSVVNDTAGNRNYPILQWFTWYEGERYLCELTRNMETVVRFQKLDTEYWPVVAHRIYPDPHTLYTPGCADFTEDKQRARAILQNYGLDAAKMDVLPMWLFDGAKIKNKQQLRDWKAGKMIEGKNLDANAIFPLTKPTIHQFVQGIMQDMEMNAQKALATPEIQQGILFKEKRTATEIAETSANVDTRYSLAAKCFGLTDAEGAYIWLDQYKRHWLKTDKKTIRLVGAFGPKPMPITKDTFDFKKDPDVKIESRVISQAKKREERNSLAAYGQVLISTPGSNLRYFAKKMGRLFFSKDETERLLPPTIDEMRAEDENEKLEKNSLEGVVIEPTDDHTVHMEIHSKAADTKAKFAHIEAHKKAMMVQRNRPELFAPPMMPGQGQENPMMSAMAGVGQGQPGTMQGQVKDLMARP